MRKSLAGASLAAALLLATPAHATGMQGHIYVSQCAREQLPPSKLKALLDRHADHLVGGSYFPDSGYAANDGYGELAHWEQFVEGYVRWIRSTFAPPYTEGDAAKHVAFLLGAASHGMVDQTFDILFMDKAAEIDGDTSELDTMMDVVLVVDRNRKVNPPPVHDAAALASIFAAEPLGYRVEPATLDSGVRFARAALGFVVTGLARRQEEYRKLYPWAGAHYLDRTTPGAYPHSGRIVTRYWEEILRRIEGADVTDALVVGMNPPQGSQRLGLEHGRVDANVTLFTGIGVERSSVTRESFYLRDAAGTVVPTEIRLRGDRWATTLQLKPTSNLKPNTDYVAVLTTAIETLDGKRLPREIAIPMKTVCAPGSEASCAPVAPIDTTTECPMTDREFATTEESAAADDAPPAKSPEADAAGCRLGPGSTSSRKCVLPAGLFVAAVVAWLRRRRA